MKEKSGAQQYFEGYADNFISSYDAESWKQLKGLKAGLWRDLHEREQICLHLLCPLQGKRVLDIGCGDGRYGLRLSTMGVEDYTGIDFSEVMIAKAKESAKDLPQLKFFQMGFDQFSSMKPFDHTFAMGVLDYIADPKAFLTKALSMTTKSVIVSIPKRTLLRGSARILRYRLRGCPIWLYSFQQMTSLLNSIPKVGSYRIFPIQGYGMDFVVEILPRPHSKV